MRWPVLFSVRMVKFRREGRSIQWDACSFLQRRAKRRTMKELCSYEFYESRWVTVSLLLVRDKFKNFSQTKLYGQKYTSTILNIDGISINTCACKCKDGVLWLTIVCLITGSNCQNYEDEEEDNQCSLANRTCRNIAQYVPTFQKTNQRANRVAHRAQIHEER